MRADVTAASIIPLDENGLLRDDALPCDGADDAAPVAVPSRHVRSLSHGRTERDETGQDMWQGR